MKTWMYGFIVLFVAGAVGASLWFGFFRDVRSDIRDQAQQQRENKAVNADPLPVAKLQVELKNNKRSCAYLDSVEIADGGFIVYFHNSCSVPSGHIELNWKQVAVDGTVVNTGGTYIVNDALDAHEKAEWNNDFAYEWKSDPRIVKD